MTTEKVLAVIALKNLLRMTIIQLSKFNKKLRRVMNHNQSFLIMTKKKLYIILKLLLVGKITQNRKSSMATMIISSKDNKILHDQHIPVHRKQLTANQFPSTGISI